MTKHEGRDGGVALLDGNRTAGHISMGWRAVNCDLYNIYTHRGGFNLDILSLSFYHLSECRLTDHSGDAVCHITYTVKLCYNDETRRERRWCGIARRQQNGRSHIKVADSKLRPVQHLYNGGFNLNSLSLSFYHLSECRLTDHSGDEVCHITYTVKLCYNDETRRWCGIARRQQNGRSHINGVAGSKLRPVQHLYTQGWV
ncbi:hypothetical protein J6590_030821 [Homalodisca vitripennis]|nr:hypothetical protein J6590_030821 [Homalodisca vitripennis]